MKPRAVNEFILGITFAVDFNSKKGGCVDKVGTVVYGDLPFRESSEPLNTDAMARELSMQFSGRAFSKVSNG